MWFYHVLYALVSMSFGSQGTEIGVEALNLHSNPPSHSLCCLKFSRLFTECRLAQKPRPSDEEDSLAQKFVLKRTAPRFGIETKSSSGYHKTWATRDTIAFYQEQKHPETGVFLESSTSCSISRFRVCFNLVPFSSNKIGRPGPPG